MANIHTLLLKNPKYRALSRPDQEYLLTQRDLVEQVLGETDPDFDVIRQGDPARAQKVLDDLMTSESLVTAVPKAIGQGLSDTAGGVGGLVQMAEEALGTGTRAGKTIRKASGVVSEFLEPEMLPGSWSEWGTEAARTIGGQVVPQVAGIGAAGALGRLADPASKLARNIALGYMGGQATGQNYGRIRDRQAAGQLPGGPGRAAAASLLSGGAEVLTEFLPTDVMQGPGKSVTGRILGSMLSDIPGEELSNVANEAIARNVEGIKESEYTPYAQQLLDPKTAFISALSSGGMSAGHAAVQSILSDTQQSGTPELQVTASELQKMYDDLMASGEPDAMEQFQNLLSGIIASPDFTGASKAQAKVFAAKLKETIKVADQQQANDIPGIEESDVELLSAGFQQSGIENPQAFLSEILGREIQTPNQLSPNEFNQVMDLLEAAPQQPTPPTPAAPMDDTEPGALPVAMAGMQELSDRQAIEDEVNQENAARADAILADIARQMDEQETADIQKLYADEAQAKSTSTLPEEAGPAPKLAETREDTINRGRSIFDYLEESDGDEDARANAIRDFAALPRPIQNQIVREKMGLNSTQAQKIINRLYKLATQPAPSPVSERQEVPVDGVPVQAETEETELPAPESTETVLVGKPVVGVSRGAIAVKPDLMQFKRIEEESGINERDKLTGKWDDVKAGTLLLWEPADPNKYGLKDGQRYILVNGHHRVEFGDRAGVGAYNAQIIRESEGFSASDARAYGAEVNIADGKGDVYEQVRFLRGQAETLGKDAALERGRQIGARGRKAASIAFDAGDSLYNAFVNETLRKGNPEENGALAAAIAEAAPGDDALQRVGIRHAERRATPDEIRNLIEAARQRSSVAEAAGQQFDLFGQDDSALEEDQRNAEAAMEIQKEIRNDIAAISGAAKRPEVAKKYGVNVKDQAAVKKKVQQLRELLDRWQRWASDKALVQQVRERAAERKAKFSPKGAPANVTTSRTVESGRQSDASAVLGEAVARETGNPEFRTAFKQINANLDLANVFREVFGVQVVTVRNTRPELGARFNGIFLPGQNILFLDESAEVPAIAAAGHELLHQLRVDSPEVYREMLRVLAPMMQKVPEYAERINAVLRREGLRELTDADVVEEIIADFVGDSMTKPSFWSELSAKNQNVFVRLANRLLQLVRELMTSLGARGYGASKYFTDLAKAEKVVADALAKYVNRGFRGLQTGGVRGSFAGVNAVGFKKAQAEGRVFPGKYDGKDRFEIDDTDARLIDLGPVPGLFQQAVRAFRKLEALNVSGTDEGRGQLVSEWDQFRMRMGYPSTMDRDDERALTAAMRNNDPGMLPTPKKVYVSRSLHSVFEHPEFFANYPDARDIQVVINIDPQFRVSGSYLNRPGSNDEIRVTAKDLITAKETLLHELQHAIQEREGFAKGGSLQSVARLLTEKARALRSEARKLFDASVRSDPLAKRVEVIKPGLRRRGFELEAQARALDERSNLAVLSELSAVQEYMRIAGEIEARDVADRSAGATMLLRRFPDAVREYRKVYSPEYDRLLNKLSESDLTPEESEKFEKIQPRSEDIRAMWRQLVSMGFSENVATVRAIQSNDPGVLKLLPYQSENVPVADALINTEQGVRLSVKQKPITDKQALKLVRQVADVRVAAARSDQKVIDQQIKALALADQKRKMQADANKRLAALRTKLTDGSATEKRSFQREAAAIVSAALPISERGALMTAILNATTPAQFGNVVRQMTDRVLSYRKNQSMNAFRRVAKKLTSDRVKNMRPEFREPIVELLSSVTDLTPAKIANMLAKLAERSNAPGIPDAQKLVIPASVDKTIQTNDTRNIRDLDPVELDLITEQLNVLVHLNKVKNSLIGEQKYRDALAAAQAMAAHAKQNAVKLTRDRAGRADQGTPEKSWLRTLWDEMSLQFDALTRRLGEAGRKVFYSDVKDGRRAALALYKQGKDTVRDALKQIGIDLNTKEFQAWQDAEQTIETASGPMKLTRAMKLELLAHLSDQSTFEEILRGGLKTKFDTTGKTYEVTEAQLRQVWDDATKEEKSVVAAMKGFINGTLKHHINRAMVRLEGREVAFADDYFPRARDTASIIQFAEDMDTTKYVESSLEDMGMLKKRVGTKAAVLLGNAFADYDSHINRASSLAGLAVPIRNARTVLGLPDFKKGVTEAFGAQYIRRLKDQLQGITESSQYGSDALADDMSGWIRTLLNNISVGYLGLNPSPALKQISGVPALLTELDAGDVLAGLSALSPSEFNRIRDLQEKHSPLLWSRYDSSPLSMVVPEFSAIKDATWQEKVMSAIQWADRTVSAIAWSAAERQVERENPDLKPGTDEYYEAVARKTEETIARTQNVTDMVDMSGLQMASRKQLAYRLGLMFASQGNAVTNMLRSQWERYQGGKQSAGKTMALAASVLLSAYAADRVVGELMRLIMGREDKEKPTVSGELLNFVAQSLSNFYGGNVAVPILREVIDSYRGKPQTKRSSSENPLVSSITRGLAGTAKLLKAASEYASGEVKTSGPEAGKPKAGDTFKKAFQDLVSGGLPLLGIPSWPARLAVSRATAPEEPTAKEEVLQKLSEFKKAKGKAPDEKQLENLRAKYEFREAQKRGDRAAMAKALKAYRGNKNDLLRKSNPLAGLSPREKAEFLRSLSREERARLLQP